MPKTFKAGEGRCQVEAKLLLAGMDIVLTVYGGTHPHVGAVALAIPKVWLNNLAETDATTSVLILPGHRDDVVAKIIADIICRELNRSVVVSAGLHLDNAGKEEIDCFIKNCSRLADQIVNFFKKNNVLAKDVTQHGLL